VAIRDTIPPRRVAQRASIYENLGAFVIMWRVDGHEHHPVWVARPQLVRDDLPGSHVLSSSGGLPQAAFHVAQRSGQARMSSVMFAGSEPLCAPCRDTGRSRRREARLERCIVEWCAWVHRNINDTRVHG
jgi:hypothetical protein